MSTSKKSITENHARELLDFVIYGDNTLVKLEETPVPDCDNAIRRCNDAISSIGSSLKFATAEDVCEECQDVHGSLINDIDGEHSDIESYFSDIVEAYQNLEKQNEHLRRIIVDLIRVAVESVNLDEIKEFEEQLILKKLEGKL